MQKSNVNIKKGKKSMKKISLIIIVLLLITSLMGCKKASNYTDEEHIKNVSKIIEENYLKEGVTYKLRPLYNEEDKLAYFVVDFFSEEFNTFFYIKIQEKDMSLFFSNSLYSRDNGATIRGGLVERVWTRGMYVRIDKEKVAKYETDKDGNKVLRYSSPFEEANVADDVKCYLAHKPRHSGEFVPAIKEKSKYINLITMKDNKEYDGVDSISFTAIAMFNL